MTDDYMDKHLENSLQGFTDPSNAEPPKPTRLTIPEGAVNNYLTQVNNPIEHNRLIGVPRGYDELFDVLHAAFHQGAFGKGEVRHAAGRAFIEQPIMVLQRMYGSGFALGQAAKKMEESQRMETNAAIKELYGAINYLAAAIVYLDETEQKKPVKE